jgi:hypothetical protein
MDMTAERTKRRKKPTERTPDYWKYRRAQKYLKEYNIPTSFPFNWEHYNTNAKDLQNYYISVLQSIAYEQEQGVPHSRMTLRAVKRFLKLMQFLIRVKVAWWAEEADFAVSDQFNMELLVAEHPELGTDYVNYVDAAHRIGKYWNNLTNSEQDKLFKMAEILLRGSAEPEGFMRKFIDVERVYFYLNDYLELGYWVDRYGNHQTNPIILFEIVRDIEHMHGSILGERFLIGSGEWKNFASQLTRDAFSFSLPTVAFGYDGKKKKDGYEDDEEEDTYPDEEGY